MKRCRDVCSQLATPLFLHVLCGTSIPILFCSLYCISHHTEYWKFNPVNKSKIINIVTEKSRDQTYMQLGRSISTKPLTFLLELRVSMHYSKQTHINLPEQHYHSDHNIILLLLQGIGQPFYFEQSPHNLNQFTIYTYRHDGRGRKLYLKPRSSRDTVAPSESDQRDIVASAEQDTLFNFRLTPANPNNLTLE